MKPVDKLPPHSEEMERGVLGCVLQSPANVLNECISRFKCGADVFYDLRYREIYLAAVGLHSRNEPVDVITVHKELKAAGLIEQIGGIQFLSALPDASPSPANLDFYADSLAELYMQRKTLAACTEAANQVYDNSDVNAVISSIESKLQVIREIRANDVVVVGKKAAQLLSTNLEERFELKGRKSGVVTGIDRLDKITDGLQFGEQTIIGARPSQGKTALATTIIHRACLTDKVPTLVVTLEMSIQALCRRLLAKHCRISLTQLRDGSFTEKDFNSFKTFNLLMSNSPIYFMDAISGTTSASICQSIRRMAKSHGVKLVAIDYLQKIHAIGTHEKRTYEVAQVSGALKAAAVDSGVALLTLAQLNREPEQQKGRAPRLSDLADSSQIERDGDCIGLLERNREDGKSHQSKLHIAKQRDGEVGVVEMHFEGQFCSFENVSQFDRN